ncbi:MAG: hypothetical protein Kow0037_02520 [Calditrichia bacterium]
MRLLLGVIYLLMLPIYLSAQSQVVEISLTGLNGYLQKNSLIASKLKNELKAEYFRKKSDLKWSNPELEMEYEKLSHNGQTDREAVLLIKKNFTLPWVYWKKKKSWGHRLAAAELTYKSEYSRFIYEMKSDYVQIKILERQLSTLKEIHQLLKSISEKSGEMHAAGTFSGMEQSLLQMALFNLDGTIVQLQNFSRALKLDWKRRAGLTPETEVILTSSIGFPVPLPDSSKLLNLALKMNPELQQMQHQINYLKARVNISGMSAVDAVTLGGGYKETGESFRGLVLSASLPLPILNKNGAEIQLAKLTRKQAETDYLLHQQKVQNRVIQLYQQVSGFEHTQENLRLNRPHTPQTIDQIVSSYKEGWSTLNEMLSGIELYQSFLQSHLQLLQDYYHAIFELEYLTGTTLITEED